jgi:hypothetical protein
MPDEKTSERNQGQPLSKPHPPIGETALPSVQPKIEKAERDYGAERCKEENEMAAILNPSGFSVWMQTWLPIIFSGLVVIVVAIQAFIYNQQRKLMNDQRGIMDKQLTSMNDALSETRKLASEARAANDLTSKAMKGNLGAVVDFSQSMQYPDWERQLLEIQFVNRGKVDATDFEAEVEIVRETLPERQILARETFKIGGKGTIVPTNRPLNRNMIMRSASTKDGELVRQTRETVIVRGRFSYMDGFEKTAGTFCNQLLELHFASANRGSEIGWRNCEDVPRLLETAKPPETPNTQPSPTAKPN